MKKSNYKPQIPDLMEAVFDAVYLTFDPVSYTHLRAHET